MGGSSLGNGLNSTIGVVDLCIAGAFRALPLEATVRVLTPLGVAGLALLVLTGLLLVRRRRGGARARSSLSCSGSWSRRLDG